MTSRVVADSSPLIAFERIGRLDVLSGVFGTVLVPPAVA
jgi:predicted nucleic acid-binding protein